MRSATAILSFVAVTIMAMPSEMNTLACPSSGCAIVTDNVVCIASAVAAGSVNGVIGCANKAAVSSMLPSKRRLALHEALIMLAIDMPMRGLYFRPARIHKQKSSLLG